MSNHDQKKQDTGKHGINPVTAAVTGAVVGAGMVAASVLAMNDQANRAQLKGAVSKVKSRAKDVLHDVKKQAQLKRGEIEKNITAGTKDAKKAADKANDSLHHEVKNAIRSVKTK
ncbi:hypothetical protein AUK40_05080 [Candidatus Wirthbacteria bacterium CG2_30_54_11]|uniref:YtxH domain-containing protein n=1 Tax=Candidatus Wirthbacteria bacterium CG2_30_54_11 TaxID=1817892 RepID=A0A1J5IPQ3_9BACT|nr:MAG: hypothetical protein AUK40_05080 [Candidatus Wirthbacteria bacterium CG2_30_54_11]